MSWLKDRWVVSFFFASFVVVVVVCLFAELVKPVYDHHDGSWIPANINSWHILYMHSRHNHCDYTQRAHNEHANASRYWFKFTQTTETVRICKAHKRLKSVDQTQEKKKEWNKKQICTAKKRISSAHHATHATEWICVLMQRKDSAYQLPTDKVHYVCNYIDRHIDRHFFLLNSAT